MSLKNLNVIGNFTTDSKTAPREVKKQTWEESRIRYQKEETYLIKRYVSQIRKEVDYRDLSYEDIGRVRGKI